MQRVSAHFEKKEPFFEGILSNLRFKKVIKYIPQNSHVLDLGSGYNGEFLQKIRKTVSLGIGVDLSVNQEHEGEINLFACNLNDPLPFAENEFDVVTSLANLEHLENPEAMLREAFRVLAPGGTLLVTTPSIYGKPFLELMAFLGLVSKQEIRDHKHYFDKKMLKGYCHNVGFSFCEHKYFQLGMNNFLRATK